MKLSIAEVKEAEVRIKGKVNKTELIYSNTFSEMTGNQVFLKPENFQRTGSFKIRGAYNKISLLGEKGKRTGVIAASAGNHGQGVALAAREQGIKASIVMPVRAPLAKIEAIKGYGAEAILYGKSYDEAFYRARELQQKSGEVFIHPFDDPEVIAGQGTITLDIFQELPDIDYIIVPIGGGGLASGVALTAKEINPEIKIIGVESCEAPSMQFSLASGEVKSLTGVNTIADGIAVKTPGKLTFKICRKYLDDIVTVSDEEIAGAILMLMERAKMVVEGAGAVGLAALINDKILIKNKRVVVIISGGNIDFNIINRIIERGLARVGRKVQIRVVIDDRPGSLQKVLALIAALDANIISIRHNHYHPGIAIAKVEVELELETREQRHIDEINSTLKSEGYID